MTTVLLRSILVRLSPRPLRHVTAGTVRFDDGTTDAATPRRLDAWDEAISTLRGTNSIPPLAEAPHYDRRSGCERESAAWLAMTMYADRLS